MNQELWQVFYSETEEIIQGMEADLLSLEKDPEDKNRINAVFRAAHTLKGNAATIGGMDRVVEFAHAMENALDMLRNGRLALTDQLTSLFLEAVDDLKSTLNLILAGKSPDEEILGAIESRFAALEPGKTGIPRIDSPQPRTERKTRPPRTGLIRAETGHLVFTLAELPPFPDNSVSVDWAEIEKALFADYRIFGLRLSESFDLKTNNKSINDFFQAAGPFVDILATEKAVEEDDNLFYILVSSMIEQPGLLATAIGIPEDRITLYDVESVRKSEAGQLKDPKSSSEPSGISLAEYTSPPAWMMETVRVNIDLIDRLLGLAGELVIGRNQLNRILHPAEGEVKGLSHLLQHVDHVTNDIQEHTMQMRMQPLGNVLDRFPKVVEDLAGALGKDVEIEIIGSEVELDKSILQVLSDPMTHLIRNCLDHGIETPALRKMRDKPVKGRISIKAYHDEGHVNITIADDGGGIDPENLADKAIKSGILEQSRARLMNDRDKLNLIFRPGFSTAEAITDVSGRGVGMDVVRTNIERIGGSLEIDSIPGWGTTIVLRLPLTLAIIPCLLVKSAGRPYALPQRDVIEMVCITREDFSTTIESVGNALVMRRRGKLLPLVRLGDILAGHAPAGNRIVNKTDQEELLVDSNDGQVYVVVIRLGLNRYGLVVDKPLDTEEIVVKPLSDHIKHCRFFSGTTILGDGSVAMILSAGGMASDFGLNFKELLETDKSRKRRNAKKRTSHETETIIWFNYGENEFFALPITEIARLEMISPDSIKRSGNTEYLSFRGETLEIIRMDDHLQVARPRSMPDELYVIIPKTTGHRVGILATRIIDTIDTEIISAPDGFTKAGVRGASLIGGNLTLFINSKELSELHEAREAETDIE